MTKVKLNEMADRNLTIEFYTCNSLEKTILNGAQQSNDFKTRIGLNKNRVLQLVANLQSNLEIKAFSK